MTLGQNIANLRKAKKLSQNELGKQAKTSGDLIGRYERDEVKPSIDVAKKIANALGVSLDYLVGSTDLLLDKISLKGFKKFNNSITITKTIYMLLWMHSLEIIKLNKLINKERRS